MFFWRHIPLLRFLVPFIGGIICTDFFLASIFWVQLITLLFILVSIGLHFYLRKKIQRSFQFAGSIIILLLFFLSGILLTHTRQENTYTTHFSQINDVRYMVARVIEAPQEKEKSVSCLVQISAANQATKNHKTQGKAQVYLAKDSASLSLSYGDYIIIRGQLNEIAASKNPFQFNFKKYYATTSIYHNGYLTSERWHATGGNKVNPLYALGYKWRSSLQNIFDHYFKDVSVRGVAEAIVFGYKEDLDENWLEAFSKTGTIHVLAVSGLHVGIIYTLLSYVLLLGSSKGRSRVIKSIIILLALFLYCLVTGFSPSVSRAAIMFATVIVAKAFQRKTNLYNTLSFACFILLLVNPLNIYNVGFQFSFLAVIGIVFYTDYFKAIWRASSKTGDKVMTLICVSLAAQLTTFPLGLYYFHQFPNYFLLSNLLVLPCISVVLYLGVFMVMSTFIYEPVAQYLADLAEVYIRFIVQTASYIQQLPYSIFANVHITFNQLLMVYVFLLVISIALVQKWWQGYSLALIAVMGFIADDYVYQKALLQNEFIVFDVKKEILIGFRVKDKLTLIASKYAYTDAVYDYTIQPYLVNNRISKCALVPMEALALKARYGNIQSLGNGFVWFDNKSYFLTDAYKGYLNNDIEVNNLVIGSKKSESFLNYVKIHIRGDTTIFTDKIEGQRFEKQRVLGANKTNLSN